MVPDITTGDALTDMIRVYDRAVDRYVSEWGTTIVPALGDVIAQVPCSAQVLDAGCGPGRNLAALTNAGFNATGVGLSVGMVSHALSCGLNAVVGDIRYLPFAAGSFGEVWWVPGWFICL